MSTANKEVIISFWYMGKPYLTYHKTSVIYKECESDYSVNEPYARGDILAELGRFLKEAKQVNLIGVIVYYNGKIVFAKSEYQLYYKPPMDK